MRLRDVDDLLQAQAVAAHRLRLQRRQAFQLEPGGVGRGGHVIGAQPRARQPALVAGLADAAVDAHRLRRQQIAKRTHQRDIEYITVAKAGQFGKAVGKRGHRKTTWLRQRLQHSG